MPIPFMKCWNTMIYPPLLFLIQGAPNNLNTMKWTCPTPCSNSKYGRTFYTSTKKNPRLFPRVKRDSRAWREGYSLRTGVERCIKRQKVDYYLEDSKGRSSRHWNIRTYCISMCQHADAWLKEAEKLNFSSLNPIIKSLLSL